MARPPITDSEKKKYEAYQALMWHQNLMIHCGVLAKVDGYIQMARYREVLKKRAEKPSE